MRLHFCSVSAVFPFCFDANFLLPSAVGNSVLFYFVIKEARESTLQSSNCLSPWRPFECDELFFGFLDVVMISEGTGKRL
jgi:hypothetical protein